MKIARQGQLPLLGGSLRSIELGCSGCLELEIGESTDGGVTGLRSYEGEEDVKNSDQEWFADGFITVVVIQPDLGAKANGLKDYLRTFDY